MATFKDNLFRRVGRSSRGTATIKGSEVAAFKLPLPDLDTQAEISSALKIIETKEALHSSKRDHYKNLFRTLLHELMTAKTRVHDLRINSAQIT